MIQRGDVVWVDFGNPQGSTPAYRRPAIVVQADGFNQSVLATVMVVPLTSNLRLSRSPGNVLIPQGTANLPQDSVAVVAQVTTASKAGVEGPIGMLPAEVLHRINAGLRLVLGL